MSGKPKSDSSGGVPPAVGEVTIRDRGRLPKSVLDRIEAERRAIVATAKQLNRDLSADALSYFEEKRYRLFAWCVMPNHVHVVARLFPTADLASAVHSWKSFTSKRANGILGRRGTFWQREYYDHLIRNDQEFERAIRYVAENPAKANLRGWKWLWVRGRDARSTAAEDGGATQIA